MRFKMDEDFKRKLKEELECIVCLDLSVSPIRSCKNGHILCGTCFGSLKVKKCPMCKSRMSHCDLAERLVKKHDIRTECKNSESGCKELIRTDQMNIHLSICEYRLIKCFDSRTVRCDEKYFNLEEFGQHLKNHHKTPKKTLISGGAINFNYCISQFDINNGTPSEARYGTNLFDYEGQQFLFQTQFQQDTLFWWITILGGVNEAGKFVFKTSILQRNLQEVTSGIEHNCTWKLPVLPIHGHHDINSVLETGKFASIHRKALKLYSMLCEEKSKFAYGMQVKMTRASELDRT